MQFVMGFCGVDELSQDIKGNLQPCSFGELGPVQCYIWIESQIDQVDLDLMSFVEIFSLNGLDQLIKSFALKEFLKAPFGLGGQLMQT